MFKIYSKINCPYCTKVKNAFYLTKQSFEERILDEDFTKQQFYTLFGHGASFPQVMYNEDFIGGCRETVLFLKENNMVP
ncbi:MAG: glutaredoxin [Candidatus Lokiarchaeota archaeon]|nr:glutaredoxin [Candidatus Lokiarchaeota archaeon]